MRCTTERRQLVLLGYMSRYHEDLEKIFTDEQKEIFEKFHDCWSEYIILYSSIIKKRNGVKSSCNFVL